MNSNQPTKSDKFVGLISKLRNEATRSRMNNKHAAVAVCKGKIISPKCHNYMRSYMCGYKCVSMHAEMAVVNYLLNTLGGLRDGQSKQCILQSYKQYTND